jgi:effector-binding domain-containing protein
MKWIEENGYQITESPRESYIDGIWNKENEEDWLTEIQIPIG